MDPLILRRQVQQEQQDRAQHEQRLLGLGPAMPGSLLVRYAHRGRITTRKDRRGLKGPYYFVSCKGRHRYVRPGELERVKRLLGNHKSFKVGVRATQRCNQRIEALFKKLWRRRIREGRR